MFCKVQHCQTFSLSYLSITSFRFYHLLTFVTREDEERTKFEVYLNVFERVLKNDTPESFSLLFFLPKKVSLVIYTEGGSALSR